MAGALVECVPNVSEGRDPRVIGRLADAVRGVPGVRLADVHADADHHRSVFTFLGAPEAVERAAVALASAALDQIDMRGHRGVHRRIGAVDVVPFVPLRGMTLGEAAELARGFAETLAKAHDLPVYLYGEAARRPERRSLHAIRGGEYEGLAERLADPAFAPDAGPARLDARSGATAVGAREVLIAYNVWLRSANLSAARSIARTLRESSGGLPRLQALGFPLARHHAVQVSMNLLDHRATSLARAFDAVKMEAARRGVAIARGELVGLAPRAAFAGRSPASVGLPGMGTEQYLDTHVDALA